MEFHDRSLTCRDCGNDFLFTAGEQTFFNLKGLKNDPRRCHECRSARYKEANANKDPIAISKTLSPVTSESDSETPVPAPIVSSVKEITEIVCAECGQKTTVPFKPRHSRPVYCSKCYIANKAASAAIAETSTEVESSTNEQEKVEDENSSERESVTTPVASINKEE
jgi:CxxC-x17-CxxC domain-containing protein